MEIYSVECFQTGVRNHGRRLDRVEGPCVRYRSPSDSLDAVHRRFAARISGERRRVEGPIAGSACSMNWCKVQAVVHSAETSPGWKGMLVSGAEA